MREKVNKSRKVKERIFMKPGRTNKEDRENFIKYWVKFMKSRKEEEWSEIQNKVINSQLQGAKDNVG